MPEQTPGQVAYAAFMRDAYPGEYQPWSWLEWRDQHGWEAAAQAVRAMEEEGAPTPGPMHFGHTMHATQGLCGTGSPWVALLPRLVTCQACIALMRPSERKEVPHG